MNHSLVSKCLTRSFEKVEIFKRNAYTNVSPSRIHFSVITELIMLGEDILDNIAHCFAKHNTQTCKKFYVQFFSNREAERLSWKSLQMFTNIAKEEEKAIKLRESKLCKTSIPTSKKIKSWYKDIRNILKLSDDLDLTEKGLEALINQFKNEMRVDEDLNSMMMKIMMIKVYQRKLKKRRRKLRRKGRKLTKNLGNLKKNLRREEEPVVVPSQALKSYKQNQNHNQQNHNQQNHNQQNRKNHQGMQICKDLEIFHLLLLLMTKRRRKKKRRRMILLNYL